jgi:hypothetical protein
MSAADPPYTGFCFSDPSAPTCSIFATGLGSDGYNWFTGVCAVYPLDSFPPTSVAPDGAFGSIVFDANFPSALSNNPDAIDLFDCRIWIHNGYAPDETRSSNINIGVKFFTLDGVTQIGSGWSWSAAPSYSEGPYRLAVSAGVWVATTAAPIRVRVYADSNFHDPLTNDYSIEWGAAVWTDRWCGVPRNFATIVG